MSNTNTGGPAYPTNNWQKMVPMSTGYHEGMTLRDYFAAKMMRAWVGNPPRLGDGEMYRVIAERAYRMADAMLKAREQ